MRRFIICCIAGALIFVGGVLVGKYVLSPPVEMVVIDVDKLTTLIEKYNVQAGKIKKGMATMKTWNENSLIDPPGKEDKK